MMVVRGLETDPETQSFRAPVIFEFVYWSVEIPDKHSWKTGKSTSMIAAVIAAVLA